MTVAAAASPSTSVICVTSPAASYRCVESVTTHRPLPDRPVDAARDETLPIILFGFGAILALAVLFAFVRNRRSRRGADSG
jgi:hypothetical protein